ncbi:MAG: cytochrome c biogenesis protein CcsA [Bacteroidota bacterium]
MEIDYAGEQPLWGIIGHGSVVLAFVTAIFSAIVNFLRTRPNPLAEDQWRKPARIIYYTHFIAVAAIFATLFLMIWNHRFEYQYVWQHSKRDMAMNYILACLWEGQEGSTLLWLLWHAVIGFILVRTAKQWEAPVITVLSLVQVFLAMMLLGWYFGDIHVGSSPFNLIREREENIGLPWTLKADYLTIPAFSDGRGLNPLLQNYWMTIHPPTLFLGFALVTIPFAFAISALWLKRYTEWQRAALPWAYAGVGILGIGILMGGAWAYESLSFGGFWAWDPVENASLVPWLTLVGAAHVMLIYRIKGQSLFTTLFLTIISFLLIVYSTFLTKSGVLSETSVHAFTEDGLNQELVWFMSFFLWLTAVLFLPSTKSRLIYSAAAIVFGVMFAVGMVGLGMLIFLICSLVAIIYGYNKQFSQKKEEEEELWSREFWMFIGSLLLTITAGIIIFKTSLPVVNKFLRVEIIHDFFHWLSDSFPRNETLQQLANGKLAPEKNVIANYNGWTLPFAVLVGLLMAVTQFFKYKKDKFADFSKKLLSSFWISVGVTAIVLVIIIMESSGNETEVTRGVIYHNTLCGLLVFTSVFTVAANGQYWYKILKGKIKNAGASVAHIGFGLLMLGVVISTWNKDVISRNTSSVDVTSIDRSGDNSANIFLRRGDVMPMGDYMVRYTGREYKLVDGTPYVYFSVDYMKKDKNGQLENAFTLKPFIQINERMGNAAEPDTRHYLHKDIYTFIKFVPMTSLLAPGKDQSSDYSEPKNHTIARGDTIALDNSIAVADSIYSAPNSELKLEASEVAVAARFRVIGRSGASGDMKSAVVTAYYVVDTLSGGSRQIEARDSDLGIKLTFYKLNPQNGRIDVYASELNSLKRDFIVLEASVFPGINVLWIGCIVMLFGTMLAVRERWKLLKKEKPAAEPE